MRDLTGPTQGRAIRDLIQNLMVGEALSPSRPLWILSAWLSDIPVIDNSARQFSSVDPEWPSAKITLCQLLRTSLRRGGSVAVVMRDVDHNRFFIDRLKGLSLDHPGAVKIGLGSDVHEKGIVGADFDISGSMNFTYRGIEVNDEHLIFRTTRQDVEARRLTLAGLWSGKLNAPN